MSEQLTALFEQLRGSQPPTPFAPPEQVRRRGRQRNHRQALAAGSAVLAVAGLGTGWAIGVADQPAPPPPASQAPPASLSPPTSAPPTSAPLTVDPPSVPASRLLEPDDFTAIGGVTASELEGQGREWPWLSVVSGCPEYRADDYPTVAKRHDGRGLQYLAAEWVAWEIVESYPDANANLADIRKAIATCPKFQYLDGVEIEQTVVAERFAGDDSLLVRVRRGERNDYMVVVRVGALVATLLYSDGPEADARDMATAMEARLH
jgi:hypothetical protein